MIIEVKIATRKAGQCRGMRQWAAHCLKQFSDLVPGVAVTGSQDGGFAIQAGGTDNLITFGTDSTNTIFHITLQSVPIGKNARSEAEKFNAPPVLMLAFLLALLRAMPAGPGPGGDYDTVAFSGSIGKANYTESTYRDMLAELRKYVQPGWYLPYAKRMDTPAQFFASSAARSA